MEGRRSQKKNELPTNPNPKGKEVAKTRAVKSNTTCLEKEKLAATKQLVDPNVNKQGLVKVSGNGKRKLVLRGDDEFAAPLKEVREEVVPWPKRPKGKCLNKWRDYKSIFIRSPPFELIPYLQGFTSEQKDSVKEMGFESILGTTVGRMPLKLGHWLVENYDPDNNALKIGSKSLVITRQTVHDVYGFPMGTIPINTLDKSDCDSSVAQEFKGQFQLKDGRVRMSNVLPELNKDVTGGRKFKLNFLVSVMTTFLGATACGTVNQRFLPCIEAETDIKELDWCSYALDCLNTSRKSWEVKEKMIFYTGPLLLLVVWYASSIKLAGEMIERNMPLMNNWTAETLKKIESKEVKNGGFGKLKLADDAVYVDNDADEEVLMQRILSIFKNKRYSKVLREELINQGDGRHEYPSDDERKEFESECDKRFKTINTQIEELDDWLSRGLEKYPYNATLISVKKKRDKLFGLSTSERAGVNGESSATKEAETSPDAELLLLLNE